MEAKERAQQLFQIFFDLNKQMTVATAKDCALICCNEIIRQTEWVNGSYPVLLSEVGFYKRVKKEIELL